MINRNLIDCFDRVLLSSVSKMSDFCSQVSLSIIFYSMQFKADFFLTALSYIRRHKIVSDNWI